MKSSAVVSASKPAPDHVTRHHGRTTTHVRLSRPHDRIALQAAQYVVGNLIRLTTGRPWSRRERRAWLFGVTRKAGAGWTK